jgi:hypothetical protein
MVGRSQSTNWRDSYTPPNKGLQLTAYSLRSGFRQQLNASVAMTSKVKRGPQLFLGLHAIFSSVSIGRVGAGQRRRLILLLSVGWVPPDLPPSGACLTLGTRIPVGLVTPSRVTPYRGGASSNGGWQSAERLRHQ